MASVDGVAFPFMSDVSAPSWARNPDHVTIAVREVDAAVELLGHFGFRRDHDATIDGGAPAEYMGMPTMRADHVTLVLVGCGAPLRDPAAALHRRRRGRPGGRLAIEPHPTGDEPPGAAGR